MRTAKLNLVILAALVGGMLWVEQSHRIKIEASAPASVAGSNAAMCPENESVPFSADCMLFIRGGAGPDIDLRLIATDGALAESPELP
jgi:hypothetical protein